MDRDAVVEELYALDTSEFTARRDALAAQAKRDGDPDLAKQVRALRRPTAAAAALNRLARDAGDELADYLALGERLRETQAALRGSELRELSQDRQRAAAALVERADALAGGLSEPVRQEVDETLRAAVADPAASRVVASGQLTKALRYAGFGEVDITAVTATPLRPVAAVKAAPDELAASQPAPKRASPPQPKPRSTTTAASSDGRPSAAERLLAQRREQAASELADAERAVEQARQAAETARTAHDDAEQGQSEAQARVEDLREQLAQARFAVRDAQRRATSAASGRAVADKTLAAAEKTLTRARDRLAHLAERPTR